MLYNKSRYQNLTGLLTEIVGGEAMPLTTLACGFQLQALKGAAVRIIVEPFNCTQSQPTICNHASFGV